MSKHLEGVVLLLIGVGLYCSPVILPVIGRLTLGRVGLALGASAVGFVLLHVGFSLVGDDRMVGRAGRSPSSVKQIGRAADASDRLDATARTGVEGAFFAASRRSNRGLRRLPATAA